MTQSGLVALLCGFARLAGWAWFDPLLGRLPGRLRVFFAAALAVALWPRLGAAPESLAGLGGALALTFEFAWGAALALMVRVLFAAVAVAFSWLGASATGGLLATDTDQDSPTDAVWRRLAFWLAAMAFLAGSGHLLVVDALLASFEAMPVAGLPEAAGAGAWVQAGSWLLLAGLKLALPLLLFVLILQLAYALVLRREAGFDPQAMGLALGAAALLLVWVWAVPLIAATMQAGIAQLGVWLAGGGGR